MNARDHDVARIIEMLYERDTEAFARADWSSVQDDFDAENFVGYSGGGPEGGPWKLNFPTLEAYRDEWLRQANDLLGQVAGEQIRSDLLASSRIASVEIDGDHGLVHKVFDGEAGPANARRRLFWQTYYFVRKRRGQWRITGFAGYLPNDPRDDEANTPADLATQGPPYSPAREACGLVAISGQGPLDDDGNLVGEAIEEQAHATLERCRRALGTCGCAFTEVFKVNVYLADLDHWARFNDVYRRAMPAPLPARTTVGAALLMGMLVEIDMLAQRRP